MSYYRVKVRQGRHLDRWQNQNEKAVKTKLKNPSYQIFQELNLDYQLCDCLSTQQKKILVVNVVSFTTFHDGGLPYLLLYNIGGVRYLVDLVTMIQRITDFGLWSLQERITCTDSHRCNLKLKFMVYSMT